MFVWNCDGINTEVVYTYFIVGVIFNKASILPILVSIIYPFMLYLQTNSIKGAMVVAILISLLIWSHRKNILMRKTGKESSFRKVIFGRNLNDCVERK